MRRQTVVRELATMHPTTIELVDRLDAGAVLTGDGVLVVERGTPEETAEKIRAALEALAESPSAHT